VHIFLSISLSFNLLYCKLCNHFTAKSPRQVVCSWTTLVGYNKCHDESNWCIPHKKL